ncbi:MAG: ComEC/Rec2 family competence protein [Candidatus Peregrinibacteria bacterium]
MLHPERLSAIFLSAFVSSIFLLQWWQKAQYPLWLWILLAILFVHVWMFRRFRSDGCTLLLGIMIAFLLIARTTHVPSTSDIDAFARNQRVTLTGIISDEPDRRALWTQYTVRAGRLETASGAIVDPITGLVLVRDKSGWPQYDYGDTVSIKGKLARPEPSETFRYDHYLSRFGIYALVEDGFIEQSGKNRGSAILSLLYHTKDRFEAQINRIFPEPSASLLAGLLTGSRRGIPEHLSAAFQAAGLSHIVAISGFNVGIVIVLIGGIFIFLPLQLRVVCTAVGIILFVLFVGASASVVRAGVMGILSLLALATGRKQRPRLSILWALALMIAWNPKVLWYDAGFQLSFLAVIGILELTPLLSLLLQRIPNTFAVRDSLTMTLAAQIMTAPLIIFLFGRFSLIAPLANILTAPAIPLAMLLGFAGVVISFLCFPLGQVVSFLCFALLSWITSVATILARIPFASTDVVGGIVFLCAVAAAGGWMGFRKLRSVAHI